MYGPKTLSCILSVPTLCTLYGRITIMISVTLIFLTMSGQQWNQIRYFKYSYLESITYQPVACIDSGISRLVLEFLVNTAGYTG